jgi:hypothetical protein
VESSIGLVAMMLAAHDRCACNGQWRKSIDDISVWFESECGRCYLPSLKMQHPSPANNMDFR